MKLLIAFAAGMAGSLYLATVLYPSAGPLALLVGFGGGLAIGVSVGLIPTPEHPLQQMALFGAGVTSAIYVLASMRTCVFVGGLRLGPIGSVMAWLDPNWGPKGSCLYRADDKSVRIAGPYAQISQLKWSPDGSNVLFRGAIERFWGEVPPNHLFVARADGSGVRMVSPDTGPPRLHTNLLPFWSPDSREIAIVYTGDLTVTLMARDGSNVRDLGPTPPTWWQGGAGSYWWSGDPSHWEDPRTVSPMTHASAWRSPEGQLVIEVRQGRPNRYGLAWLIPTLIFCCFCAPAALAAGFGVMRPKPPLVVCGMVLALAAWMPVAVGAPLIAGSAVVEAFGRAMSHLM